MSAKWLQKLFAVLVGLKRATGMINGRYTGVHVSALQ